MRIARALALAGIASRRKCEVHILAGEVAVNGHIVQDLGRQVDPGKDEIAFRGRPLRAQRPVYFILHKPAGYTTTASDPHAEKTVYELLPKNLKQGQTLQGQALGCLAPARVFPVGRLDRDSTGLLLFTNDGEMANRLTHPRYEAGKRYEVKIDRPLDPRDRLRLLQGVRLEEGLARVEQVEVLSPQAIRLLLKEGKKREIRRMLHQLGYQVTALSRIAFGPLRLANLTPGQGRHLTPAEVADLRRAARLPV